MSWISDVRRVAQVIAVGTPLVVLVSCGTPRDRPAANGETTPRFEPVQPELFSAPGAQPNAWADYDNDGDLDLFVGFRRAPNRLYRNDNGEFTDVAPDVGLADTTDTRAASWGDFDGDGHLDLYVGFPSTAGVPNRLYRNQGNGARFVDVAARYGVDLEGTTRQPVWVDYDQDGDVDLFVAFRDRENRLFRNDGDAFTDVSRDAGIDNPRRTVGVVWFDMDRDGDLDLFVANQNGDTDALYRNEGDRFVDVAPALGMDWPDRGEQYGSVGPAVTDYDNDGDLDLFIATYGPDVLWQNQGDGSFRNVGPGTVLAGDYHSTTAAWGDYDNDGWPDLVVASYLRDVAEVPDHLFRNVEGRFVDVTPQMLLAKGVSHGVSWADFDGDGDLDLALANNNVAGSHPLYRNELGETAARRSLRVTVLDARGRWTLAGSEVRVSEEESGRLLGTRLVDTGGGYCSQSAMPVHFGLPRNVRRVRVEVTVLRDRRRESITLRDVDPARYRGTSLEVQVGS
jgi:hypothetical protein